MKADSFAETTAWQTVGWAEIGSENEDKPYLLVKSIEENFTDLVADETITTDGEELLNWLTEKNHPVLAMEPLL